MTIQRHGYRVRSWVVQDGRTTGTLVPCEDLQREEWVDAATAAAACERARSMLRDSLALGLYADESVIVEYTIEEPSGWILYRGRVGSRGIGRASAASPNGQSRNKQGGLW